MNTVRRSFNVVTGNEYRVRICGATENTVLYITNSAGVRVTGACDDDGCGIPGGPSAVRFQATATGIYFIWAYNGNLTCTTLGTHAAWTVSVECLGPPPVPANNEPCGAIPLSMATTSCTTPEPGTTLGATQTAVDGLDAGTLNPNNGCGAVNFSGGDVWYSLVVPSSGLIGIEVQESGLCAAAIGLYTAPSCSAGFTWITGTVTGVCSIDGLSGTGQAPGIVFDPTTYGLAPGAIVYVRVWERANDENGSFTICAYNAQPPANDEPCGATLLIPGDPCVPVEYNTVNAQPMPSGLTIGNMSCGLPGIPYNTPALWNPVARDVWFRVVVPPTENMTVTLFAGTLTDMAMAWYRATGTICGPGYGGSLTQITSGCNDNIGGGNLMPRINSNTAGITLFDGETIYIRVWNKKALEYFYHGTFSICVTPNNPPVNDNPCGAIELEVGAGECTLMPGTNENASNTGLTFAPGASSAPAPCGTPPALYNDVWYTLVVPTSVTAGNPLIIDTDDVTTLNFAMAAYRDASGTGCPTLIQLAAAGACISTGSSHGNGNMPRLVLTPPTITPGERLYIRVWTEVNNQQGQFSICAHTQNPPACQGTFFDSGGAGNPYANGETITRTHCPEKVGDVVTLNFSQFNLENGWDFIRIYNQTSGAPSAANLIGSYTGTNIPSQIASSITAGNPQGCLIVVFVADAVNTAPGYTYKVSCGPPPQPVAGACNITSYSPGAITYVGGTTSYDPGGSGGTTYPGNLGVAAVSVAPYHVRYCPTAPSTDPVSMTFTAFDVEDNFDGLYIFDANITPGTPLNTAAVTTTQFNSGNPAQLTYSGPYSPAVPPNGAFWGETNPGTFTATNATGCLTLVFYTDAIVSGSGWEAQVSCGPPPPPPPPTPCDATFYEVVGGATGNYTNNVTAAMSTQTFTAPAGRTLIATFSMFNIEANWDKMYVFDGPTTASPMISSGNGVGFGPAPFGAGAYWGTTLPGPFTSSAPGGSLTFVFISDASVVRPGWTAKIMPCTTGER